jgi:glycosyltransferase involved in cell wall biosynthesis
VDFRHLFLFDISGDVHLPTYLRFLVREWIHRDLPHRLTVLTWHPYLREPIEAARMAESAPLGNIQFLSLTPEEHRERLQRDRGETARSIPLHEWLRNGADAEHFVCYQWTVFQRYAGALGATDALITHIDDYLQLFATGVELPVPISGICLRPRFHYAPSARPERFALSRVLNSPNLKHLFFLDPFVAESLARFAPPGKTSFLPDPVAFPLAAGGEVDALRERLAIEPGRVVLLLFGHLARRKGAQLALQAIARLPENLQQRIALVLAGFIHPALAAELEMEIAKLPAAQIVTSFGHVPDSEVPAYFGLTDVVLIPYLGHVGMSGILLLACSAGKPVLSADFGLPGELTRSRRLGLTVDPEDPQAFADAMARFATEPVEALCELASIRNMAEEHAPEQFAEKILDALGFR